MQRLSIILVSLMSFVLFAVCAIGFSSASFLSSANSTDNQAESGSLDTEDGVLGASYSSGTSTYYFSYTGGVQSLTGLPVGSSLQIRVYGAQGGIGTWSNQKRGGYGGYATGIYTTTASTLYVVVGGYNGKSVYGGYNGGGNAYNNTSSSGGNAGGGGGATHVSTRSGVLSSLSSYKSTIVMVAGGGGGAEYDDAGDSTAGGGGGTSGQAGLGDTPANGGAGGTQSSGYAFGQGGPGTAVYTHGSAGGGGGYYGGYGGGSNGDGGGGSGYLSSGLSSSSMSTGVRSGNGYCTITVLNSSPSQSNVPSFTLTKGSSNIVFTASGSSVSGLNVSDPDGNTVTFNTAGVYTVSSVNSSYLATSYINYTLTSTTLTITSAKTALSSTSFYVQVKDSLGATCMAQFKITRAQTLPTQSSIPSYEISRSGGSFNNLTFSVVSSDTIPALNVGASTDHQASVAFSGSHIYTAQSTSSSYYASTVIGLSYSVSSSTITINGASSDYFEKRILYVRVVDELGSTTWLSFYLEKYNEPPEQYNVPTFTTTRGSALSSWTVGTGTRDGATVNTVSALNVYDYKLYDDAYIKFNTTAIYTQPYINSRYNASTLGWLQYTISDTSLTITNVKSFCTSMSFYVVIYDDHGAYIFAEFKITTTDTGWTENGWTSSSPATKDLGNGDAKIGKSTTIKEPDAVTESVANWDTFNALGTSRNTVWVLDASKSSSNFTVKAADIFTANYPSYDSVYFNSSYNRNGSTDFSVSFTATSDSGVSGYNTSATITLPSTTISNQQFYYLTVNLVLIQRVSISTDTSVSKTYYQHKTETLDIIFRIDNVRPEANTSSDSEYMTNGEGYMNLDLVADANGATIKLSDMIVDTNGSQTINRVVVPTGEFIALDKYGERVVYGSDEHNTNYDNQYTFGGEGKNNITAQTLSTTAQGDLATGFDQNSITSSTSYSGIFPFIRYNINSGSTALTVYPLRTTRNQYDNSPTTRTGHFYVLIQLIDSGEPGDDGIWIPLAIKVKDQSPEELADRPSSLNMTVGESVIFSPFGFGSTSSDWSHVKDSDYSANGDNGYGYQGLATDPTINPHTGGTYDLGYRATYIFDDFLFIEDMEVSTNNKSIVSSSKVSAYYGNGGDTLYTSWFGKFFTVEYIDLYLPANTISEMTDVEINAFKDTYFTYVSVGGYDLIKFKGIQVTPIRATTGTSIEFGVDMISSRDAINDENIETSVTARVLISIESQSPEVLSEDEFDSNNDEDIENNNPIRSYYEEDGNIYFDYITYKNQSFTITPYDFVKDYDMQWDLDGGTKVMKINSTNSNPRKSGYGNAVSSTYDTSSVVYANGLSTSAYNSLVMNNKYLDSLSFGNVSLTSENNVSYTLTKGTTTKFDEITITGISKSSDYSVFTITVQDKTGKSVNIYVRVYIRNTLPTLNESFTKLGCLNLTVDASYASNSDSSYGESMNDSGTIFNSTLYNTREYTAGELVNDVDTQDQSSLVFLTTSIKVGTLTTMNDTDTFVEYADAENTYVMVRIATGSGTRSSYTVLRIIALSSTQGIANGLWVQFSISDGEGTADFLIQVEVYNSTPKLNTASYSHVDTAIDDRPVGYYWDLGGDTWGKTARYFVSSQDVMFNATVSDDTYTAANTKLIGYSPDANQHIVPLANLSSTAIPTLPGSFTRNTSSNSSYPSYGQYSAHTDFMKISIPSYIESDFGSLEIPEGMLSLTYYDPKNNYEEVDQSAFESVEDIIGLEWAVKFDIGDKIYDAFPIYIEFTVASSNQEMEFANPSLTGETAGGYGSTNAGIRKVYNAEDAKVNDKTTLGVNLLRSDKVIVNNFTEYQMTANNHAIIDAEGYVNYTERDINGEPTKLHFGDINVGSKSDDSLYIPYSYFATTYKSTLDTSDVQYAIGLGTTSSRELNSSQAESQAYYSLSISDGSMTWSGSTFSQNPYINVEFETDNTTGDSATFLNPNNAYYSSERKIIVYDEANTKFVVSEQVAPTDDNYGSGYLDDYSGLVISKKSIRSDSALEFRIDLIPYSKSSILGGSEYTVQYGTLSTTVVVDLYVANDKMVMGSGDGTEVYSVDIVTDKAGNGTSRQAALVSTAGYPEEVNSDYVSVYYNSNDDATELTTQNSTYRDKAMFSVSSISNSFNDEQLTRLLNEDKDGINTDYVGSEVSILNYYDNDVANMSDPSFNPNEGYEKFFSITMPNDSFVITINPVEKTQLNIPVNTPEAEEKAILDSYNLCKDSSGRYYFPLDLIVYDYSGTADFMLGSYGAVEIRVYITNSAVSVYSSEVTRTMEANSYFTLNVSSLMYDSDMRYNTNGSYYSATQVGALDEFSSLTIDYVAPIGIQDNMIGNTNVELVADDNNQTITITFGDRSHKDVDGEISASFKLTFSDSANNANTLVSPNNTMVINIVFKNSRQQVASSALSTLDKITMHTGDTFVLATTTYSEYMSNIGDDGLTYFDDRGSSYLTSDKFGDWANASVQNFDYDMTDNDHGNNILPFATDDMPSSIRFSRSEVTADSNYIVCTAYDLVYHEGTNIQSALTLAFTANGAGKNIPITIAIYDESYDNVMYYTFYVDVLSTSPIPKEDTSLTEGLDTAAGFDSVLKNYVYTTTVRIGDEISFNLTDFVNDIDYGDNAKLVIDTSNSKPSHNDGPIYIDEVPTYSDQFITIGLNGALNKISIVCTDFHNDDFSKVYSQVKFYIADPSGADSVLIVLNVYAVPSSMVVEGSVNGSTSVGNDINVKGLDQYAIDCADDDITDETVVDIIKKTADTDSDAIIIDPDLTGSSSVKYSVKIYTMFYVQTNGSYTDYSLYSSNWANHKEDFLAVEYNQVAQGGELITYATNGDGSVEALWNHISIEDIKFSEDGSVMYLAPLSRTPLIGTGTLAVLNSMKILIEVTKHTSSYNEVGVNKVGSYTTKVGVDNSIATAVGDTGLNYNYYNDGNDFLEYHTTSASYRDYDIADITNPSNNNVLFTDCDLTDDMFVALSGINPTAIYKEDASTGSILTTIVTRDIQDYVSDSVNIYPHTVNGNNFLRVAVNYKPQITDHDFDLYKQYATVIEYTIEAYDSFSNHLRTINDEAKTVSTSIKIYIENGTPEFVVTEEELPENAYYTYNEINNSQTITLALEKGKPTTLSLSSIFQDLDYVPGSSTSESIKFLETISGFSYENIGTQSSPLEFAFIGEDAWFSVYTTKNDYSELVFNALTYDRDSTMNTYLYIEDEAGARTSILRIELVTANSAPTTNSGSNSLFILGNETPVYQESGLLATQTLNILDYVSDYNPTDYIEASMDNIDTYLRIVSFAPIDNSFAMVTSDGAQSIFISPKAGSYGAFKFSAVVADGPLSAHTSEEENSGTNTLDKYTTVWFTVTVSRNPENIDVKEVDIPYMKEVEITASSFLDFESAGVSNSDASNFVIKSLATSSTEGNIEIYKNGADISSAKSMVSSRTTDDVWSIKAVKTPSTGRDVATEIVAVVGTVSDPDNTTVKVFTINNTMNYAPVLKDTYSLESTMFFKSELNSNNEITISVKDIFYDKEFDTVIVRSVSSKKSVLVEADIDVDQNAIVLKFNGSGSSEISVIVSDAVGDRPALTFIAVNADLPSPSLFVAIGAHIQSDPALYILIGCILLILLIIIILCLIVSRKRKRMQAEVNKMLIQELDTERNLRLMSAALSRPQQTQYMQLDHTPGTVNIMIPQNPNRVSNPNMRLGQQQNNSQYSNPSVLQLNAPPVEGFGVDDE